jgi:hypothetical protein
MAIRNKSKRLLATRGKRFLKCQTPASFQWFERRFRAICDAVCAFLGRPVLRVPLIGKDTIEPHGRQTKAYRKGGVLQHSMYLIDSMRTCSKIFAKSPNGHRKQDEPTGLSARPVLRHQSPSSTPYQRGCSPVHGDRSSLNGRVTRLWPQVVMRCGSLVLKPLHPHADP